MRRLRFFVAAFKNFLRFFHAKPIFQIGNRHARSFAEKVAKIKLAYVQPIGYPFERYVFRRAVIGNVPPENVLYRRNDGDFRFALARYAAYQRDELADQTFLIFVAAPDPFDQLVHLSAVEAVHVHTVDFVILKQGRDDFVRVLIIEQFCDFLVRITTDFVIRVLVLVGVLSELAGNDAETTVRTLRLARDYIVLGDLRVQNFSCRSVGFSRESSESPRSRS